jgi:deaminated glutathione amidase
MSGKAVLQVAVCQMTSIDSTEKNFEQIKELLRQIPKGHALDLICFPENSLYMRIKEGEKIQGMKLSDPVFHQLSQLAKEMRTYLHFGSLPLRIDGHLRNASVSIRPDGEVTPTYYKIHLFDIDLEGQPKVKESDIYKHGEEPQIIQHCDWHIGQTICYDLRFSELFSYYAQHSVELILVPSSFLVTTGQVHWEILLRARAIESQAYVIAAAQAGRHVGLDGSVRETYGHSLVIDPWGHIIKEGSPAGPELLLAELDLQKVALVRRQIPMRSHRRLVQIKR